MSNPVMLIGNLDLFGGFILLNLCLSAILLILLAMLIVSRRRKRYYARIRMSSPRLERPKKKRDLTKLRWTLWTLIAIAIIIVLGLLVFYIFKWALTMVVPFVGVTQNESAAGSEEQAAETEPTIPAETSETVTPEPEETEALPEESSNLTDMPIVPEEGNTFLARVKEFALTYAGYVIAGFVILIILISVLSSKKQD